MSVSRGILAMFILAFMTGPLPAQSAGDTPAPWTFGVNLATRAGESVISWTDKSRSITHPDFAQISLGFAGTYAFADDIRLQAEVHVNLSEHDFPELRYEDLPPTSIPEDQIHVAYLTIDSRHLVEIPVLVAWRLPLGGFPLRLLAGPMFTFAPWGAGKAHLYVMHDGQPRDIPIDEIARGDVAPFSVGLETGLQLETAVNRHVAIQTDLRYSHQFTPYVEEDFVTWNIPDALRLRLGVMFRF